MSTATVAMAAVEGRRLARNPAVWISFLPAALWVRATLRTGDAEDRLFLLIGYGLGLSGFVMVSAVVLAVLRGRLEHAEELLGTLAVGPDRRSIGHAASTLALAGIGGAVTVAVLIVLRPGRTLGTWDPTDSGDAMAIPRPNLAQLLQGPLALVAVATFAIALVRWVPTWLVLVPLLVLLMMQMLFVGVFHGVSADGERWLFPLGTGIVNGPWTGCEVEDPSCSLAVAGHDATTPWWHAGYLVAAACWFTSVAVVRHRRDRIAWWWFGGTLAVFVTVAAIQFAVATEYPA